MPNVALIPDLASDIPALGAGIHGYPEVEHKISSTVSDIPLETGARASDHQVLDPDRLVLRGWVSDLGIIGRRAPVSAWQNIKRLQETKEPFEVVTPWFTYREMSIQDVRAFQLGGAMEFVMRLVRLDRIDTTGGLSSNTSGEAEDRTAETIRGVVRAIDVNLGYDEGGFAYVRRGSPFVTPLGEGEQFTGFVQSPTVIVETFAETTDEYFLRTVAETTIGAANIV